MLLIEGKILRMDSGLWQAEVGAFCVRAEGESREEALMELRKSIASQHPKPRFDFRMHWLNEDNRFVVETSDVTETQAFILRRSRDASGISAEALARKLNLNGHGSISQYEGGGREPSMTVLLERLEASGRIPLFTTISENEIGPDVFDSESSDPETDAEDDEDWGSGLSVAKKKVWDSWIRSYSPPQEFWWASCLTEIGNIGKETVTREEIAAFLVAELKATGRDAQFLEERRRRIEEEKARRVQELEMFRERDRKNFWKKFREADWNKKIEDVENWARRAHETLDLGKSVGGAVAKLIMRTNCPVERFDRSSGPFIPYYSAHRLIQIGVKATGMEAAAQIKGSQRGWDGKF